MSTTTVLAEFLLVGFLGLMTIMAGLLVYLDVDDVPEGFDLKGTGTLVVVVVSITAYLVGVLTHRVGQLISGRYVPFLTRFKWFTKLVPIRNQKEREKWLADYFLSIRMGQTTSSGVWSMAKASSGSTALRCCGRFHWESYGVTGWHRLDRMQPLRSPLVQDLVLGLISWLYLLIQVQNNRIGLQRARMVLGDQRRKS